MTVFKFSAKTLLAVGVLLIASSTFAGFWEWSTPYQGPKQDIMTLVVTSNYATPVMMAQLIQNENRQPFILLPKKGESKIFFWPAGKKNLAIEIREKNLPRFIKFVNPKQVIVLGDKRYVEQKYLDMIDKNITIVVVKNDNWEKSAMTLQKLLKLNTLHRDFKRLNDENKSGLYKPTKSKQPVTQDEVLKQDEEVVKVIVETDNVETDIVELDAVRIDSTTSATDIPVPENAAGEVKEPEIKAPKTGPVLIEE
jgi:hypothetical protein